MHPGLIERPARLQHPVAREAADERRSRWLSLPAVVLSFAVWMLWSVVVVHLPAAGFRFSLHQLFWLAALPALCGATLRLFDALGVAALGGRRFTVIATASLLLPAVGIGLAVQRPSTPFEAMVVLALLCGLGGANGSGAIARLARRSADGARGHSLERAAGLGPLGIVLVQALAPLAIAGAAFGSLAGSPQATAHGPMWLQNAGFVWVPLILAATAAAWLGLDDRTDARSGLAEQAVIFTRGHNAALAWLHLGSLGSFIGLAASVPLLVHTQFDRPGAWALAWLGPLLGAALRPLGSWMAERRGGARVTLWAFAMMAAGAGWASLSLLRADASPDDHFAGFVASCALLFGACGLAHAGTCRMVAQLFVDDRLRRAEALPSAQAQAAREGGVEATAALGFASAIGAYGGFFIPKSVGAALATSGSAAPALALFTVFYLSCMALTWWAYGRRNAANPC